MPSAQVLYICDIPQPKPEVDGDRQHVTAHSLQWRWSGHPNANVNCGLENPEPTCAARHATVPALQRLGQRLSGVNLECRSMHSWQRQLVDQVRVHRCNTTQVSRLRMCQ